MTKVNERRVSDAGALLDALVVLRGTTIEGLLAELNARLVNRGEAAVSRATFWKWRAGQGGPCREHALLMEDVFGISPRAWGLRERNNEAGG